MKKFFKSRMNLILSIVFVLAAATIFTWMFLVNIYEVKYDISVNNISDENRHIFNIEAIPLNSFGTHALLRSSESKFYIEEGNELIEVIPTNELNDVFKFKSVGKSGKVVLLVKSKYSLLPTKLEIPIAENHSKEDVDYS